MTSQEFQNAVARAYFELNIDRFAARFGKTPNEYRGDSYYVQRKWESFQKLCSGLGAFDNDTLKRILEIDE